MSKQRINLDHKSYFVSIETGSLFPALTRYLWSNRIKDPKYLITSKSVYQIYRPIINKVLSSKDIIVLPDGERAKTVYQAVNVIKKISKQSKMGKPTIIALGGGAIGDLAGFVASIYKRGVPYYQIPTTLLAQVDSSVGGKTAVDLPVAKNIIGSFYQPKGVLTHARFLKSLPTRQLLNGFAEVIKYGIIADRVFFEYLERNHNKLYEHNSVFLKKIIDSSVKSKSMIVEKDEFDTKNIRALLNFGHTIGHAIEASSGYQRYLHGEAVALGSLCAARISEKMGVAKENVFDKIKNLYRSVGLKTQIKGIPVNKMLESIKYDKKFTESGNAFVLLKKIGKAYVQPDVPYSIINSVIRERIKDEY